MNKSHPHRFLAGVVALAYAGTNVLFASSVEANFWEERRSRARREEPVVMAGLPSSAAVLQQIPAVERVSALSREMAQALPADFTDRHEALLKALSPAHGSVRSVALPSGEPRGVVVHIQDVHGNAEAQAHIGQAVQSLMAHKAVDFAALEGAFAPLDLSRFQSFDDQDIVRRVADHLLAQNQISGPAHAAFTAGAAAVPFVGIDDAGHHGANVAAYRNSVPAVEGRKQDLSRRRADAERRKSDVYNGALKTFDEKVGEYRAGRASLGDHVRVLAAQGPPLSPALADFARALDAESSLDFKRVEEERARLIERLMQTLRPAQIDDLLRRSVAYRAGEMHHADFYGHLRALCGESGAPLSGFPAMDAYVGYVLLTDRISADTLFEDIAAREKLSYARLARTPEEKALVAESDRLSLAAKLYDFALTPQEWRDYDAALAQHPSAPADASFEAFYREAQARDQAIAEKLLNEMSSRRSRAAVLVAGGFHASGIAERLRRRGVAVVGYVPRIDKVDTAQGSTYLSVFTRDKTPLEEMFQGEKLFLAHDPAPDDITRGLAPALIALLRAFLRGSKAEGDEAFARLSSGEAVFQVAELGSDGSLAGLLTRGKERLTIFLKAQRDGASALIRSVTQESRDKFRLAAGVLQTVRRISTAGVFAFLLGFSGVAAAASPGSPGNPSLPNPDGWIDVYQSLQSDDMPRRLKALRDESSLPYYHQNLITQELMRIFTSKEEPYEHRQAAGKALPGRSWTNEQEVSSVLRVLKDRREPSDLRVLALRVMMRQSDPLTTEVLTLLADRGEDVKLRREIPSLIQNHVTPEAFRLMVQVWRNPAEDADLRKSCTYFLSIKREQSTGDYLRAVIGDEGRSLEIRAAAVTALADERNAMDTDVFMGLLQDAQAPEELRKEAVKALGHIPEARVTRVLADAMARPKESAGFGKEVAKALGERRTEAATDALFALLENTEHQHVIAHAIDALSIQIGEDPTVMERLVDLAVQSEDIEARDSFFLDALYHMMLMKRSDVQKQNVSALRRLASSDSWNLSRLALELLVPSLEKGEAATVDVFIDALRYERGNIFRTALTCFLESAPKDRIAGALQETVVSAFREKRLDKGEWGRMTALMGRHAPPELVDYLMEVVADPEIISAKEAIEALGLLGDRRAIPALVEYKIWSSQDFDHPIVVEALARLGHVDRGFVETYDDVMWSWGLGGGTLGSMVGRYLLPVAAAAALAALFLLANGLIRNSRLKSIARFEDGHLPDFIAPALSSSDRRVRSAAVMSISLIGEKRHLAPLLEAISMGKGTELAEPVEKRIISFVSKFVVDQKFLDDALKTGPPVWALLALFRANPELVFPPNLRKLLAVLDKEYDPNNRIGPAIVDYLETARIRNPEGLEEEYGRLARLVGIVHWNAIACLKSIASIPKRSFFSRFAPLGIGAYYGLWIDVVMLKLISMMDGWQDILWLRDAYTNLGIYLTIPAVFLIVGKAFQDDGNLKKFMSLRDVDPLVEAIPLNNPLTRILRLLGEDATTGGYLEVTERLVRYGQMDRFLTIVTHMAERKARQAPQEIESLMEILSTVPERRLARWGVVEWTLLLKDITAYFESGMPVLTPIFFAYYQKNKGDPAAIAELKSDLEREWAPEALWGGFLGFSDSFRRKYRMNPFDDVGLLSRFMPISNASAKDFSDVYAEIQAEIVSTPDAPMPEEKRLLYKFTHGQVERTDFEGNGEDREEVLRQLKASAPPEEKKAGVAGLLSKSPAALDQLTPEAALQYGLTLLAGQASLETASYRNAPDANDPQRLFLARWQALLGDLWVEGRVKVEAAVRERLQALSVGDRGKLAHRFVRLEFVSIGDRARFFEADRKKLGKLLSKPEALSRWIDQKWFSQIAAADLASEPLSAWLERGMAQWEKPNNVREPSFLDGMAAAAGLTPQEAAGRFRRSFDAAVNALAARKPLSNDARRLEVLASALFQKMDKDARVLRGKVDGVLKGFVQKQSQVEETFYVGHFNDVLHQMEFMTTGVCTWYDRPRQIKEGPPFSVIAAKDKEGRVLGAVQVQSPAVGVMNSGDLARPVLVLAALNTFQGALPVDREKAFMAMLEGGVRVAEKAGLTPVIPAAPVIHANYTFEQNLVEKLVKEGVLRPVLLTEEVTLSKGSNPYSYQEVYEVHLPMDRRFLQPSSVKEVVAQSRARERLQTKQAHLVGGMIEIIHNGTFTAQEADALAALVEPQLAQSPDFLDDVRERLRAKDIALLIEVNRSQAASSVRNDGKSITLVLGADVSPETGALRAPELSRHLSIFLLTAEDAVTAPSRGLMSVADPLFRFLARALDARGWANAARRLDAVRRAWNVTVGPLLETQFIFHAAAAAGLGPLVGAALLAFPLMHAAMEAVFDVLLGRASLASVAVRLPGRLAWGAAFALPFLPAALSVPVPPLSFDVLGIPLPVDPVVWGVAVGHALLNLRTDRRAQASAQQDAVAAAAISRGESLGAEQVRALLLPRLETPSLDQLAPGRMFSHRVSRRLREDFEYRDAFVRVYRAEIAPGVGGRPSHGDMFWSLHRAFVADAAPAREEAGEARPVQVIEEIVSREDLPSVGRLLESVSRMRGREEEPSFLVRLIPAEPGLKKDLEALAAGQPHVSVRSVALTASDLSADFTSWRSQRNLHKTPLRLAIAISDGVTVAGGPQGDSLYAQALRAALSVLPPRPVDLKNILAIVEAVATQA